MQRVRIKAAYRVARQDLVWLTIHKPRQPLPSWLGTQHWGEYLCDRAEALVPSSANPDLYAEDIGAEYLHVLIRRVDLPAWQAAADGIECELVEHPAFVPGHYGDDQWPGVDLVQAPGDELYWLVLA